MNTRVHSAEFLLRKIPDAFEVFLGQNERVAYGYWILIEDCDEMLVLVDYVGWGSSLNYIAEDAIQMGDSPFLHSHIEPCNLAVNDFLRR